MDIKRLILLAVHSLVGLCLFSQNVGIGTATPNAGDRLDFSSTNSGLLPPRTTTSQRNSIVNSVPGLMIFNTTTQSIEIYTVYGWSKIKTEIPGAIKLIGGNGTEQPKKIRTMTGGGFIVIGFASSSANGDVSNANHGGFDYWMTELDHYGNIENDRLLGGNADEYANDIQQTTDGGYKLTGYSTSAANGNVTGTNHGRAGLWVVKLDGSGNITWNKLLGGNNTDFAKYIQQTTDGGYIIAGIATSSLNGDVSYTNHGLEDYWIVKLDGTGNFV